MTTRPKIKPTAASLESLLQCDRDSFKVLLRESPQEVTPPRFHVHQIVVNFLVNGERNGEE